MPREFPKPDHAAKRATLRNASLCRPRILVYLGKDPMRRHLAVLRYFSPGSASGIRRYYSFCDLLGIRPIPFSGGNVIKRSSVFDPFPTLSNYLNRIRKSRIYLSQPTRWYTLYEANLIKSLKLACFGMWQFPNFPDSPYVINITERDARRPQFAKLA